MELGGQHIGFHLHAEVVALCAGLLLGYWALIRRYGRLMRPQPDERPVRPGQLAAYVGGVAALYLASGWPLHDLAEDYLYSAHMVQHLLQMLVAPPLLLVGIPDWMGEVLLADRRVRRVVQVATRPLVAGLLFNAMLMFIHWPVIVDAMVASEVAHALAHVLVVVTSLLMWANVFSPVPDLVPRLSPVAQMFFLFLMTLGPTIPASFMTLGDSPLYPVYGTFPRLWGIDLMTDMQSAGLIMKIGGGFLLWGFIAVLFFRWAADQERRERGPGAPPGPLPTTQGTLR